MRYAIIYEKTQTGYGAYPPDLPGIGVTAPTREQAEQLVQEAIEIYLEECRADGLLIPPPTTETGYVLAGSDT